MTGATASVPQAARVSTGRVRLFAADGGFLRRVDSAQADELIAAGLAEWRGGDLRMIALERYRSGLNGARVHCRETVDNARGNWAFGRGVLPA
jgi:hypothetical protein